MLAAIFLMLFFGLESWISGRKEAWQSQIITDRRITTEKIALQTDPNSYFTNQILPLLRLYSENSQANLEQVRVNYLHDKGLDLAFYQFNKNGKLINTAPARAPNLWLMRNIFAAVREQDIRKVSQLRKGLDKKIEFSFGYGKDLNSIRENPEIIIETTFADKTSLIAWTSRPKGGLIVTCQNLPDSRTIFKKQTQNLTFPQNLRRIGIFNQGENNQQLSAAAHKYLSRHNNSSGNFAGYFWCFINNTTNDSIYAAFTPLADPYGRILFMGRQLLACLAGCMFFLLLLKGAENALSLKKLVITMFIVSSLIPLSGIAFTSLDNIEVYKHIYINKLRAAKEETLGNIIQNYNKYIAGCSNSLLQLTQNPGTGDKDPRTRAMAKAVTEMFPEAKITIRNSAGEPLFFNAVEISEGRETVFKSLARRLVERYIPERLNEKKYYGNLFADSIVNKDDMGLSTLLNYPNRIQLVSTGNAELLLFYRMLPATAGQCAIIQVELSTVHSIKRYLKTLQSQPQTIDGTALQISAFFPKGYRWSLPPTKDSEAETLELARTAQVTGKPNFRRFSGKTSGLALCVPSSELSGNCLVAFCSAEQLDKAVAEMKTRMGLGSLLALIMILAIAIWISRQLIAPLEILGTGITALAQRKFETKLPLLPGKDEFARLFTAFNDMMAESYDMQIAHSVQEGLVPSSFPDLPGYSMFGMLRAASDLGGDCLDCFVLPDGNLLFLVGDITGHGVGSALIMAFARAVTFHWSQSEQLSPTSLADQIDTMLRQNRTEKMFMGIICGVLNIKTNEVELVVKGHIYPLIIRNDGSKHWLGLPAYPLGIGKQKPAVSMKFSLNHGDSMLCMTDGFLEGYNRNMKTIGFAGIEAWAGETASADAKEWVNRLENRFRIWCDDDQSDDISIFALLRAKEHVDEL